MDEKIFLQQLRKLVALRTVTGEMKVNSKALDLVESWLVDGVKTKRIKNGKAEILMAGNGDLMKPEMAYFVHMDVVPGGDELFKMRKEGDKLLGRGVSDMKFSIPMGVALLNQVIEKKNGKLFVLVITTDEEVGGFEGTYYLVNKLGFRPKLLIVPDGGDNGIFVEKAKGVCMIQVDSAGKATHSSRIWEGKNANEPLVKLTNKLLVKYGKNNKKEDWVTTMNIGRFHGGEANNQVCAEAFVVYDFRFPETRSWQEIKKEVEMLASRIDKSLKVSSPSNGDPTFTSANLPVVKRYLKLTGKELGRKIEIGRTYGASDARHFNFLKVPVLMSKPDGGGIHADREWISLESCMKFYNGLERFVLAELR